MQMLKGTQEYENFGQFVADSGGMVTRLQNQELKEDEEQ